MNQTKAQRFMFICQHTKTPPKNGGVLVYLNIINQLKGVIQLESNDIILIIIIMIAYLPVIYNMQKRIRTLENEVNELKRRK